MSPTKRKHRAHELKVIFDTNAIFSASGNNVVNEEVCELIKESSNHSDLVVTWYLPEIVRLEREYQLRQHGRNLLQAIRKLEKFLDHNLAITEEIILRRVNENIETQINELRINVLPVDISKVDWKRVMVDAAFRQPPFSPTEKEKGFRDALISETVLQLVESSPKSLVICRIVLITGDALLSEATRAKTVAAENVRVLSSIDELKGLINTLVSAVDENLIQQLKIEAAALFFESKNRETYFYKEKIKERILREFADQLSALPQGADELKRGKTFVSRPRFKKKIGQRIHWISRVSFQMEAFRNEPTPSTFSTLAKSVPITEFSGYAEGSSYSTIRPELPQSLDLSTKTLYTTGNINFEVTWSVAITAGNKLTTPKIESIEYIDTTWQAT